MESCVTFYVEVLFVLIQFLGWIKGVLAVECFKNSDLGYRSGNIYNCDDPDKPECCEDGGQFTCCAEPIASAIKNQFGLWGAISAIVVVIILVFICCKKDIQLCNGDTPLIDRCRRKKKPLDDVSQGDKSKIIPDKKSKQLPSSPSTSSASSNDTTGSASGENPRGGHDDGYSGSNRSDSRSQGYSNRGYSNSDSGSYRGGSGMSRGKARPNSNSGRY